MDVQKLFQGIAVIIDDEIDKEESSIAVIKRLIEDRDIPVVAYSELPRQEVIPSIANASFVIFDWDYFGTKSVGDEEINIPDTLREESEERLISFLSQLLKDTFLPVFIFTFKSIEEVTSRLEEAGLWKSDKPKRIFVQQKDKVSSDEQLFTEIEKWLREVPSVYVLKEWEKAISEAKTKMFLEMFGYSPRWTKIVWDMLAKDSRENHREFGEFISRSMLSRVDMYAFDESIINSQHGVSKEELRLIAQGERFVAYEKQPDQAYTGDLFTKDGKKYYLNIRAQCDLARADKEGNYDPELYCIKGTILKSRDIITDDIRFTSEGTLIFGSDKVYTLKQIQEMIGSEEQIGNLNRMFDKQRNKIFFRHGTFLERNDKVIVGCIADKEAIQFDLNIEMLKYSEYKEYRVGRVLPPYIERVQQKCVQYLIREGTMPIPEEIYRDFE